VIDEKRLLETFLDLVRIDSPSGQEAAIAHVLAEQFRVLGLTATLDGMNNVVARLDGPGEPVLLAAHTDTVVPGCGIRPVVRDGVVYSDGSTILGADDKSGLAVILEVLRTIAEQRLSHPALEVVATVQEETGLLGAKGLDLTQLRARIGVSFDLGGEPGTIATSAPYHNHVDAVVLGRAAHSGACPEEGVNALLAAARALGRMPLGRIDAETTANFGVVQSGLARNIVPDRVEMIGEARSLDPDKLEAQSQAMADALRSAAAELGAKAEVKIARAYQGYRFDERTPVVRRLMAACRQARVKPMLVPTGGGSDANIFNAAGMQVVNLTTGMQQVHTLTEHIAVGEMVVCAEIALCFARGMAE
jgi:tripeptide aminopeptidase